MAGDVQSPGTLRRQAVYLSKELGDHGVAMAIDRATDGEWMPPEVRYKYVHFFTHWAVLAITRLADRHLDSTSVPALVSRLRRPREEGKISRDPWIERLTGTAQWRQIREAEEQERFERLIETGGGSIWSRNGPGEKAARLSGLWNCLTGRERGSDGPDDMEDWILDSAEHPLECPNLQAVRKWRNKNVAHQDVRQMRMGLAGYEVFPMRPIVRAYRAAITPHTVPFFLLKVLSSMGCTRHRSSAPRGR